MKTKIEDIEKRLKNLENKFHDFMDSWGPETQKKEIKEMQSGMKWSVSSPYRIGKIFPNNV